mmetsp:Transcript_77001/g.243332  ORF Transcript_77001/g.243332 Transcript_77001/m.243332 type:complete len:239 (+) Transcript_77001:210-926(+)
MDPPMVVGKLRGVVVLPDRPLHRHLVHEGQGPVQLDDGAEVLEPAPVCVLLRRHDAHGPSPCPGPQRVWLRVFCLPLRPRELRERRGGYVGVPLYPLQVRRAPGHRVPRCAQEKGELLALVPPLLRVAVLLACLSVGESSGDLFRHHKLLRARGHVPLLPPRGGLRPSAPLGAPGDRPAAGADGRRHHDHAVPPQHFGAWDRDALRWPHSKFGRGSWYVRLLLHSVCAIPDEQVLFEA